jgi:hypothetical protein
VLGLSANVLAGNEDRKLVIDSVYRLLRNAIEACERIGSVFGRLVKVIVAAMRSPPGASAATLRAARQGRITLLVSVPLAVEYDAICSEAEHPVRLPRSLKTAVERQSKEDGTSINQFVATAVAEKLSALQTAEFFASRKGRADFKTFQQAHEAARRKTAARRR